MSSNTFMEKQLEAFKEFLRNTREPITSPTYFEAVQFLRKFPRTLTAEERDELRALFRQAFQDKECRVLSEHSFEPCIPKKGFFRKYYEYTLNAEPPSVFHFMCSYTIVGAALRRNVYFDKGFYKVYPNVATLLIAPTGRCRKTSATNTALALLRETETPIFSERITPEALVDALSGGEEQRDAIGLLYAPELAVFLGRQRYLEGLVPLLTSLFDAPDYWSSKTIGRGETRLHNVALSFLGASTLEWFLEALPHEAFTGGFISRLLIVAQEDTDRVVALPQRPPGHLFEALREDLLEMTKIKGEFILLKASEEWYRQWYHRHHAYVTQNEKQAGYWERKPDHLLRAAMILAVANHGTLELHPEDFEQGLQVLDWLEGTHYLFFEAFSLSPLQLTIMHILRKAGGRLPHGILLRRTQHLANARVFRDAIETLIQSEQVREVRSPVEHYYELVEGKK